MNKFDKLKTGIAATAFVATAYAITPTGVFNKSDLETDPNAIARTISLFGSEEKFLKTERYSDPVIGETASLIGIRYITCEEGDDFLQKKAQQHESVKSFMKRLETLSTKREINQLNYEIRKLGNEINDVVNLYYAGSGPASQDSDSDNYVEPTKREILATQQRILELNDTFESSPWFSTMENHKNNPTSYFNDCVTDRKDDMRWDLSRDQAANNVVINDYNNASPASRFFFKNEPGFEADFRGDLGHAYKTIDSQYKRNF